MNTIGKLKLSIVFSAIILLIIPKGALGHNPHAFGNSTAACGACHSTHAAEGRSLLGVLATGNENDVYRNCIYCHKSGGQSKLDVYNGAINGVTGTFAASGGGVVRMVVSEGLSPVYADVTSKHDVYLANDVEIWTPGADTGAAGNMSLSCNSCHTPHGGTSCADCHVHGTQQRRLLRTEINGVSLVPPIVPISSYGENEITYVTGNVNAFCGACHTDFLAEGANVADQDNGLYTQHKRHRVGMNPQSYPGINTGASSGFGISQPSNILPLQKNNNDTQVSCLTCHFAHGTAKTNLTSFTRTNGQASTSSTLLRLDNRGVCQACHNK